MFSNHLCEKCEIEFKIRHDSDTEYFKVLYCPFCSEGLDVEESYEIVVEEE